MPNQFATSCASFSNVLRPSNAQPTNGGRELCIMYADNEDNSHAPPYVTLGDRYVAIFAALLTLRSR